MNSDTFNFLKPFMFLHVYNKNTLAYQQTLTDAGNHYRTYRLKHRFIYLSFFKTHNPSSD